MATRTDSLDSEEFVRLSLTDSTYAKVIFNDVKDLYLANEDVTCTFTMMSSIEPMAGDKVALYKVGWSCADDYIIAQPVEKHQRLGEMSVAFAGSSLPKEDGEYYQFCYITADGEIRGGSTPFIFQNSPVEDLFSEEDIENDLMLIQTRTSILEGSLQKAIREKTAIKIEKERLEKDCDSQQAVLISFESLVKKQEEEIKELEANLAATETDAVTNQDMLKEELSQLNHFINGMKVAVSALGKDKAELEKTVRDLHLENNTLQENCAVLQSQLDASISAEKTCRIELNSTLEVVASLQTHSVKLEGDLSEKIGHINDLEKEQQDQHLQHNAISSQLADKEVMLAAMAASKSLAAEELQKLFKKQIQIEAEKCCLREQCEKFKAQIDTLEKEIRELCLQFKVILSENVVIKNENKLLLEKQAELQDQSSKLQLEVKDLHNRLALGGEEYRRKYIEWHKMQNKVLKLQKKILILQTNKQGSPCAVNLQQSANIFNEKECSSEAEESNPSLTEMQSDMCSNEVPLSSTVSVCTNLNKEQSAKIHAAMENQLQKFHITKSSSNSLTDINVRKNGGTSEAKPISSTSQNSYPYPPYYPYPYPQNSTTAGCSNLAAYNSENGQHFYMFSPGPNTEQRWLSSGSNEDSFMLPTPNNHVLIQENVQLQSRIQRHPCVELRPGERTQEERSMNSPHFIKCPVCEESIPEYCDIDEHVDNHFYLKCPVCLDRFDRAEFDMASFNKHVLEHLD